MKKSSKLFFAISLLLLIATFGTNALIETWINLFSVLIGLSLCFALVAFFIDLRYFIELVSYRPSKGSKNVLVVLFLSLIVYLGINSLFVRFDRVLDFTSNRQYSLSPPLTHILEKKGNEISFKIFYKSRHETRELREVSTLFNLIEMKSFGAEIQRVNLFDNPQEFQRLLGQKALDENQEVFCFIEFREKSGGVDSPCGEQEILKSLYYLVDSKPRTLHISRGLGEALIGKSGFEKVVEKLKQYNYGIKFVDLAPQNINRDVEVVLIVSPKAELTKELANHLLQFLESGGKIFLTLDPGQNVNFSSLLHPLGLEFSDNYVLDESSPYGQSLILTPRFKNFLSKPLKAKHLTFPLVSEVKILEKSSAKPLVFPPKAAKAYKDLTSNKNSPSQSPLAVKVKKGQGELILVGDGDFLADDYIDVYSNAEFLLLSMSHLLEETEKFSIQDKLPTLTKLKLTLTSKLIIVLLAVLIPILLLGLSFWLWYRRGNEDLTYE